MKTPGSSSGRVFVAPQKRQSKRQAGLLSGQAYRTRLTPVTTAPGRNLRTGSERNGKGFRQAAAGRRALHPLGRYCLPPGEPSFRRSGGGGAAFGCRAMRNCGHGSHCPSSRVLKLRCPRSAGVRPVAGNVREFARVCGAAARALLPDGAKFAARARPPWLRANVSHCATGA